MTSDAADVTVADTRPAFERDLVREPESCLSFSVRGSWSHFRDTEGTTVADMLAAILGMDRDTYYGLFSRRRSAIEIELRFNLRLINMPKNTLSTAKGRKRGIRAAR